MPPEDQVYANPSGTGLFRNENSCRLILCLLLLLLPIGLYNSVTRAPFLNEDDNIYVTENAHVRSGLSTDTISWAFKTTEAANWHPITWLSHALDCQLFGLNPAGPHAINILLHAMNALLLFLILEKATACIWRSLTVAAVFALHPINVESVVWIAERKNVLSMLFFLLALAAYGWYVRRPGIARYLTVTLAYALALMTKPQVITLPFVLLLLDYWPLCRLATAGSRDWVVSKEPLQSCSGFSPDAHSFWTLVFEKLPWFALSAVSAILTMKVQAGATQIDLPLRFRVANAATAYARYLGKAFWPSNLVPLYPHPQLSISFWLAALAAFGLTAVCLAAVVFRRYRPLFVGWFWFLGTLVPMIGLVQVGVQAMADRYAYIPLLGIFVIVIWGISDLAHARHWPRSAPAAVVAVLLMFLALGLHRQVGFWKDNLTLWTHTVETTQANYVAEDNVGTALINLGRLDEAVSHFARAQALRPDDPTSTLNLASYQQLRGNTQAALAGYVRIGQITKEPSWRALALVNSGYVHYSLKEYDLAQQDFEAALGEQPQNASANCGLGLLAQRTGHLPEAVRFFERSIESRPVPLTYLLLAQALEKSGRPDAASAARSRAAQITTNLESDLGTVRGLLAN